MFAGVKIFIMQYILIKKGEKSLTLYYKVITQSQPEIYVFGISGKGNLPFDFNFLISSGTSSQILGAMCNELNGKTSFVMSVCRVKICSQLFITQ